MLATKARPRPKKKARPAAAPFVTLGEVLAALGHVPPERVRLDPAPGTATKRDLLRVHDRGHGLFELVDGTLVEKPMGRPESYVAHELGRIMGNFVVEHALGFCTGADDLIELVPKLVRGPDLTFTSWARRPDRTVDADDQISKIAPDLAVEVLSPKNTRGEMTRKLREYFLAGVRVVWLIDPRKRVAVVHTAPDKKTVIDEAGTLAGGDVIPGFRLPLAQLFGQMGPKKPRTRKKK